MKKIYKILIPSAVALGVIGTFTENDTPNTNLIDNNKSSYTETESKKDVDKEENNNQTIKQMIKPPTKTLTKQLIKSLIKLLQIQQIIIQKIKLLTIKILIRKTKICH